MIEHNTTRLYIAIEGYTAFEDTEKGVQPLRWVVNADGGGSWVPEGSPVHRAKGAEQTAQEYAAAYLADPSIKVLRAHGCLP